MRKRITGFTDMGEAQAFADGMAYVNDSAIEDIEVLPVFEANRTTFVVTFEDSDYAAENQTELELPYVPGGMGV